MLDYWHDGMKMDSSYATMCIKLQPWPSISRRHMARVGPEDTALCLLFRQVILPFSGNAILGQNMLQFTENLSLIAFIFWAKNL